MISKGIKKTKYIICSLIATLVVLIVAGVTFAFSYQAVIRTKKVQIRSTNISFLFNGRSYIDTIGSKDLELVKGGNTDFTMNVTIGGTKSAVIDYDIKLNIEPADGSNSLSDSDNALLKSVEVYRKNGTNYDYLCMLNELEQYTFNGEMVTNYTQDIDIRFYYSAETAIAWDNSAKEGKFKIVAKATAVSSTNPKYVYITDMADLNKRIEKGDVENKTIVLLNDIELTNDVTINSKVGFDLNGHTLNLAGKKLTINYSTAGEALPELGLIDTKGTGSLSQGVYGSFTVNGDDCYLIADSLKNSYNYISVKRTDALFVDMINQIKNNFAELDSKKAYTTSQSLSFVLDNLRYYLTYYPLEVEDDLLNYDVTTGELTIVDDVEITSRYMYDLCFANLAYVSGYITVRGNSLLAIAKDIEDSLPNLIDSSLLLKGYDSVTATYIDYIIEDGCDGNLLDNNGLYQINGQSFIEDLDSIANRNVTIYIKLSKDSEQYIYKFIKEAEILSIEDRTNRWFDYTPIVLYSNTVFTDFVLDPEIKAMYGVDSMSISFPEGTETTEPYSRLTIDPVSNAITVDILSKNYNKEGKINVQINYDSDKAFNTSIAFKAIGENEYVTKYDVLYRLQKAFNENEYVNGTSFEFKAYGALAPKTNNQSSEVFIDYEIIGEGKDYISIIYRYDLVDEYEEQVAYYTKNGDQYTFISNEKLLTFTYVEATEILPGKTYYFLDHGEYIAAKNPQTGDGITYFEKKTGLLDDEESDNITICDIYTRRAYVELLPSKIPSKDYFTALVHAVLYTLDENGQVHYVDGIKGFRQQESSSWETLEYKFTFPLQGLIHNDSTGVQDFQLYSYLRDCFDKNNDNLISVNEAGATWDEILATLTEKGLYNRYVKEENGKKYLDFSGAAISSIKGIEYFRNIEGISFNSTGITDITYLESLRNLSHLDLGNNAITNIDSLALLDSLYTVILNDNNITSIEALRYLKSIAYVNISNNIITDFTPLTVPTTLIKVFLRGITIDGSYLNIDAASRYAFALMQYNNPNLKFDYNKTISISNNEKVAALVMRDLEEINRVYKVLYLPTKYNYYDPYTKKTIVYSLEWFNDSNDNIIISEPLAGTNFQGYTISSPIFDKEMELRVMVKNSTGYETLTRLFNITLEKSSDGTAFIYKDDGTYLDLYSSINGVYPIPDIALRNALFDTFNFYTDENTVLNGAATEANTISQADWNRYNEIKIDWSNKGITDLTGIDCLSSSISGVILDLTGNEIEDLSPLISIKDNISGLILGGQKYDLTTLLGDNPDDKNSNFTNLEVLDVSKCYDVDSRESLQTLYQIYLNNPDLYVYLDTSYANAVNLNPTKPQAYAWDPYETELPDRMSELPSILTFYTLNQEYYLYSPYDNDKSVNQYSFEFYDIKTLNFTISRTTVYAATQNNLGPGFSISNNTIKYTGLNGRNESAYLDVYIESSDDPHGKLSNHFVIQANILDISSMIIVHNVVKNDSGDYNFEGYTTDALALNELFSSTEVIRGIQRTLMTNSYLLGMSTSATSRRTNKATLGEYLENEISLCENNVRNTWKFYYDESIKKYYITTNCLASITLNGSSKSIKITGPNDSSNNILYGLRYLEKIDSLEFGRDASLGDGKDLVNIKEIKVTYSVIDISAIKYDIPLEKLSLTNNFLFKADKESMAHLRNLTDLSINISSNALLGKVVDFSFLEGLIYEENGKQVAKLKNLTMTNVISNANLPISYLNAKSVRDVYMAAYRKYSNNRNNLSYKVGSTSKNSDGSYYFVAMETEDRGLIMGANSSKNPTAAQLTALWTESGNVGDVTDYVSEDKYNESQQYDAVMSTIKDAGLKVDNVSYLTNKPHNLTSSNTLTLPKSTGKEMYGIVFGDDQNDYERDYPIEWKYIYNPNGNYSSTNLWSMDNCTTGTITSSTSWASLTDNTDNYSLNINSSNGYLTLFGCIANPNDSKTIKIYMYSFILNNGDNLFSNISDITLREWLFAYCTGSANELDGYFNRMDSSISLSSIGERTFSSRFWQTGKTASFLSKENESNWIYDLTGFGNALSSIKVYGSNNSIASTIKKVNLANQKMTDITGLFGDSTHNYLINLEELHLNSTNIHLPATLSQCSKLKILELSASTSIDVTDLANVPTGVNKLLLYYTRTMHNPDTLDELLRIMGTNSSMTLSWHEYVESNITKQNINDVKAILNTINSSTADAVYVDGGTKLYTNYTVKGYFYNVYSQYQVSTSAVNVTLALNASSINAQFGTSIYKSVLYTPSTASQSQNNTIGNNNLDVTAYDTELICYLIKNGMLKLNAGNYNLSSNVYISVQDDLGKTLLGLTSFKGFTTSTGSYNGANCLILSSSNFNYKIYLRLDYNGSDNNYPFYPLTDISTIYSLPNANYANGEYNLGTRNNSTISNVYELNTNILQIKELSDYLYFSNSTEVYTITLPKGIWYGGSYHPLTYSLSNVSNATSTFLSKLNVNGNVITIDYGKLAAGKFSVGEYRVNINASAGTYSTAYTITIFKGNDADNADLTTYDLYVEVSHITPANYGITDPAMQYAILDGTAENNIVRRNENELYTFTESDVVMLYKKGTEKGYSMSYIEGADIFYCVSGSLIFDSGRMQETLQTRCNVVAATGLQEQRTDMGVPNGEAIYKNQYLMINNTVGGRTSRKGTLITSALRLSFTTFYPYNTGSKDTDSFGLTSIQGLQIFNNMKYFKHSDGCFSNMEALNNIHLVEFHYLSTDAQNNYKIEDFSPLVNGSKDTLKIFDYNKNNNITEIRDLSFLMSFTSLEKAYLCIFNNPGLDTSKKNGGYFATSSFDYLLSKLNDKGVKFYLGKDICTYYGVNYNSKETMTNGYRVYPTNKQVHANEFLDKMPTCQGQELIDNYIIKTTNYTEKDNVITMSLPSSINNFGTFELIDWYSASANVNIIGYQLDNDYTFEGTTYNANVSIEAEVVEKILNNIEFYNMVKLGEINLTTVVKVSVPNMNLLDDVYYSQVIGRIKVDYAYYERMFTLQF